MTFSGRLEPRAWQGRDGEQRVALELHAAGLEYGSKPRGAGNAGASEEITV